MSRFIETIKLLDGHFYLLEYHQKRVEQSIAHFSKKTSAFDLKSYLAEQDVPAQGLYKCRIIYEEHIISVEFLPYSIKPINSLKIVHSDSIQYPFKFEQRDLLTRLYNKRGDCDDIIIVKQNQVTDASYANLVFFNGKEWFTPTSYLLNGIIRQYLLDQEIIRSTEISLEDIPKFEKVRLINSMLRFEGAEIPVSQIVF